MESSTIETEIDRTARSLRQLELEIASLTQRPGPRVIRHHSSLPMPELSLVTPPPTATAKFTRRKEIEARRFNGKEPVHEYLIQFDLTAKRNGWTDEEKSVSLLCALDGPARGIITEFNDASSASYASVREALLARFGPTKHTEVHEQALQDLRLQKGQSIRELAQEVIRATKLAYPDISGAARERIAIKHLLQAVGDKDLAFYVKDKEPASLQDACALHDKYKALIGVDNGRRSAKLVKSDDALSVTDANAHVSEKLMSALSQLTETTNRQLKELAATIDQLRKSSAAPAATGRLADQAHRRDMPRKPCPRCGHNGHWGRECTMPRSDQRPDHAYSQPGRRPMQSCQPGPPQGHLNFLGPPPAPSAGPHQYQQY